MKRITALLLAILLCAALFAGCQTPAAEKPTLIVGLDDTFAPMGFRDEAGNLTGFDVELATALGEELGMEIKFQPIDWDIKYTELESGNVDCLWNGFSRNEERETKFTLTQNYFNNRMIVMTNKGITIASKEDMANYNIGTQAASEALKLLMADDAYPLYKDKINEYKTYDECIMDMQAGRIDAMVVDAVLGEYKNANLGGIFGECDFDFGDDFYVIGFRKEDTELCKKIEAGLKALQASGKTAEISEKWFGEDKMLMLK